MKKYIAASIVVLSVIGMGLLSGCFSETTSQPSKFPATYDGSLSSLTDQELQERIDNMYETSSQVENLNLRHYYAGIITIYQNELILRKLEK